MPCSAQTIPVQLQVASMAAVSGAVGMFTTGAARSCLLQVVAAGGASGIPHGPLAILLHQATTWAAPTAVTPAGNCSIPVCQQVILEPNHVGDPANNLSSTAASLPRHPASPWSGTRNLSRPLGTASCTSLTSPRSRRSSQEGIAPAPTLDVIHIKGARFYGYHGVLPAENAVGQPFVVDVSLHCDLRQAGRTDDLQHTVSYADVFQGVQQIMEGPPVQLLEALAHRICHHVLTQHAAVHAASVTVSKVHIPKLSAAVSSVGVQVHRTRADFTDS